MTSETWGWFGRHCTCFFVPCFFRMLLISNQPTIPQGQRLLCYEWLMYFPTEEVRMLETVSTNNNFFTESFIFLVLYVYALFQCLHVITLQSLCIVYCKSSFGPYPHCYLLHSQIKAPYLFSLSGHAQSSTKVASLLGVLRVQLFLSMCVWFFGLVYSDQQLPKLLRGSYNIIQ